MVQFIRIMNQHRILIDVLEYCFETRPNLFLCRMQQVVVLYRTVGSLDEGSTEIFELIFCIHLLLHLFCDPVQDIDIDVRDIVGETSALSIPLYEFAQIVRSDVHRPALPEEPPEDFGAGLLILIFGVDFALGMVDGLLVGLEFEELYTPPVAGKSL